MVGSQAKEGFDEGDTLGTTDDARGGAADDLTDDLTDGLADGVLLGKILGVTEIIDDGDTLDVKVGISEGGI